MECWVFKKKVRVANHGQRTKGQNIMKICQNNIPNPLKKTTEKLLTFCWPKNFHLPYVSQSHSPRTMNSPPRPSSNPRCSGGSSWIPPWAWHIGCPCHSLVPRPRRPRRAAWSDRLRPRPSAAGALGRWFPPRPWTAPRSVRLPPRRASRPDRDRDRERWWAWKMTIWVLRNGYVIHDILGNSCQNKNISISIYLSCMCIYIYVDISEMCKSNMPVLCTSAAAQEEAASTTARRCCFWTVMKGYLDKYAAASGEKKNSPQHIFLRPHYLLDLPLQMRHQSRPTGSTVLINTVLHELLGSGGRVEHCGGLAQSHGSLNMTSKCSFDHHCHQQAWAAFTQFHHISSIHPSVRPSIHPWYFHLLPLLQDEPRWGYWDCSPPTNSPATWRHPSPAASPCLTTPWFQGWHKHGWSMARSGYPICLLSLYIYICVCVFVYLSIYLSIYLYIYLSISVCAIIYVWKRRMLRISHEIYEMKGNATNWTNHESFSAFYWNILEQFMNHDGHPLGPQPPPLKKKTFGAKRHRPMRLLDTSCWKVGSTVKSVVCASDSVDKSMEALADLPGTPEMEDGRC